MLFAACLPCVGFRQGGCQCSHSNITPLALKGNSPKDMVVSSRGVLCTQAMLAVHDTGQLLRFVQRGNDVDLVEGRAS